jgi:alkylation response protein AidB-like acyl-CoA dehydrogenase
VSPRRKPTEDAFVASAGEWLQENVAPLACRIDETRTMPIELVRSLGEAQLLGSMLPLARGGQGLSHRSYAAVSEELGHACSNVRNLVAVQDMVIHAIAEWGSAEQVDRWVGPLTSAHTVGAFALTEPHTGSDAARVQTTAKQDGDRIVVSGEKTWISFGQIADVFLVFAQLEGQHTAILVERDAPGVVVEPTAVPLGLSGSMLGTIRFDAVSVPDAAVLGFPGTGLTFVAGRSLSIGRLSTAAGCVGLARACLEASVARCRTRIQFSRPIGDQQLVQGLLADMAVSTRASRLMSLDAADAFDRQAVDADHRALMAKYHASVTAARVSHDAVQVHGAHGLAAGSPMARLFRDAKALEIIEGTTQVIQGLLGSWPDLAAVGVGGAT